MIAHHAPAPSQCGPDFTGHPANLWTPQFAGEILGLQPVGGGERAAQFRADDRAQTLTYVVGDPSQHVVGFELRTLQDLKAAAELDDAGHRVTAGTRAECDERAVRAFVKVTDPTGTSIDLAVAPARGRQPLLREANDGI